MSNKTNLLPSFDDSTNDWALISEANGTVKTLTLAFSVKRDFLSVPKTYQIVSFKGNDNCPLEFHQLERIDYLQEIETDELGDTLGWVSLDSTEDSKIILLLTQFDALEIAFTECYLETTIYHSPNAKSALYEFLTA